MRGVSFPEQTIIFGKPDGWKDEDCYGLPVAQSYYENSDGNPVPCLDSCWEEDLTDAEIEEIIRNRKVKVYLSITGTGMPPVSIRLNGYPEGYDKDHALQVHNKLREGAR